MDVFVVRTHGKVKAQERLTEIADFLLMQWAKQITLKIAISFDDIICFLTVLKAKSKCIGRTGIFVPVGK